MYQRMKIVTATGIAASVPATSLLRMCALNHPMVPRLDAESAPIAKSRPISVLGDGGAARAAVGREPGVDLGGVLRLGRQRAVAVAGRQRERARAIAIHARLPARPRE